MLLIILTLLLVKTFPWVLPLRLITHISVESRDKQSLFFFLKCKYVKHQPECRIYWTVPCFLGREQDENHLPTKLTHLDLLLTAYTSGKILNWKILHFKIPEISRGIKGPIFGSWTFESVLYQCMVETGE